MILRQYLHEQPAIGVSYLFGCGGKESGAVVDPMERPEFYIDEAERVGLRIDLVIDTHVHADHVSTGRKLAAAAGSEYVLYADSDVAFPFEGVRDGERIRLGNVYVDVMHLPGHTPEHLGLVVTDRARGEEPWFVLTGHTLMVGDMGRTELASNAEAGARALFRSRSRLADLADHIEVMPGAFAGSVCGRGLSGKVSSTIGFERRFNRAFSVTDRNEFLELMLRDIPVRPPNAEAIREQNAGRMAVAELAVR